MGIGGIRAMMNHNFEKFYLKTCNSVYRFISSRVASRQDAEDLVSEVYYKAFRSDSAEINPTKAWIFSIAANTLKNYYRDHKSSEIIPITIASTDSVEDDIISSEEAMELMTAVNKLSESDQLLVSLRYFAELPYKDISKVMGLSIVAAKTRMSRVLPKIEKIMGKGGSPYEK
jgi:RNA polymerase sigma-70 factor (ECF subfamily)